MATFTQHCFAQHALRFLTRAYLKDHTRYVYTETISSSFFVLRLRRLILEPTLKKTTRGQLKSPCFIPEVFFMMIHFKQ